MIDIYDGDGDDVPSGKLSHNELERSTMFNGKTHYKSPFSIAMLNLEMMYPQLGMALRLLTFFCWKLDRDHDLC